MTDEKAYALRAHVENFAGGSVAVGLEGRTLDLAAALRKGEYGPDGVIVTSDPIEQAALESDGIQEILKVVSVPESKPKAAPKAESKE